MDSVNLATSAEGPLANRPLRETGESFFMPSLKSASELTKSHFERRRLFITLEEIM
jgi:hypothetical protein